MLSEIAARAEEFDTRPETPARRAELMLMGFFRSFLVGRVLRSPIGLPRPSRGKAFSPPVQRGVLAAHELAGGVVGVLDVAAVVVAGTSWMLVTLSQVTLPPLMLRKVEPFDCSTPETTP